MTSVGEVCWCRSLDSLEIVDKIRVLLQELWLWLITYIWKEQFLIRNDKKTIVLYQQDEEILCVVLIKKRYLSFS